MDVNIYLLKVHFTKSDMKRRDEEPPSKAKPRFPPVGHFNLILWQMTAGRTP